MQDEDACRLFRMCVERRDERSWEIFFRRHDRRVRRSVRQAWRRRSGGHRGLALDYEELLQEVYCQLLGDGSSTFDGQHNDQLWGWMERVAEHLICDLWRRQVALKRSPPASHGAAEELCGRVTLLQADVTPEQRLLAKEGFADFLWRCCQVLRGVHERWVVCLIRWVFLNGCTSHEMSMACGGALSPRDIDILVQRLRRGLAARGLCLPRRHGGGLQAAWIPGNEVVLGLGNAQDLL